jgi:23S rRNA-/tRNA-specific pseudouridylate synthase
MAFHLSDDVKLWGEYLEQMPEMKRMRVTGQVYQFMPLLLFLPHVSKGFYTFRTWPRVTVTQLSRPRRLPLSTLAVSTDKTSSGTVSNLNPTLQWKGSSHSTSDFVTHVLITNDTSGQTMHEAVDHVVQKQITTSTSKGRNVLSAIQLLELGSVWYLPASAPRDPSMGTKPIRVLVEQATEPLQEGDYLRVHHHPRRFQTVHDYDWSTNVNETTSGSKPGVIVQEDKDKGWLVIDKPPRVPVHMTVDNAVENVAACLVATRQQLPNDTPVYVSTPQRLDQNTSGLLVVATSKSFAAYFAKLLANKTSLQLQNNDDKINVAMSDDRRILGGVHKIYKCLVCIQPPSLSEQGWSTDRAWQDLKQLADNGTVIRHYLEPSIRAPKTYVKEPPSMEENQEAWLESLLRIKEVGPIYRVVGNTVSEQLANRLWDMEDKVYEIWKDCTTDLKPRRMPQSCQAVVEIKVELLTGKPFSSIACDCVTNISHLTDVPVSNRKNAPNTRSAFRHGISIGGRHSIRRSPSFRRIRSVQGYLVRKTGVAMQ